MDTGPKRSRLMNPRYKANILSVLTFGWTLETFKLGYSRDIEENDLYGPLPEHRSDVLGDAVQRAWDHEVENSREKGSDIKPSLWRVLFKVFGPQFAFYGLMIASMEFLIRLQQPKFLGLLLRYYSPALNKNETQHTYLSRLFHFYDGEGNVSRGEAVFFVFGIIFCSAANVMVQHPSMMGLMHMGMKIRVGVCSLIYRKALKISLQNMSESSAGLVVNLMANDVNRFDTGPIFAHYLWIGPIEILMILVYVYREMGISAVYGSIVVSCVIPLQLFMGKQTAYYRKQTALQSDERVKWMKEIIMGMEVIKMYTWEQPFRIIIDAVRRHEIHFIKLTSYIRGVTMSFIMFTTRFGIFITVLVFVTYGNKINVENVFFLTGYFNIMKQTMTLYFPQAVGYIAEMKVAIQRVRDYLLSEECKLHARQHTELEIPDGNPKLLGTISEESMQRSCISLTRNTVERSGSIINPKDVNEKGLNKKDIVIKFENANSRWIKSTGIDDVQDLNLNVINGSLTCIIGAVGSGKSTLLHMVLSELPCSSGNMYVNGTVSYASQDPWLFVGTVRQNILFGHPYRKSRYMEVCKVCALERDMSLFPHGDRTIVGERGVSLSGGQRARINLARAVYKEADIYLLDDPLSAVDTQVAKHIFERCIKRFIGNKTVILVTHQIQFIKFVDQVVIMDKGKILAEGAFEELNEKELKIIQFMKEKEQGTHDEETVSMPKSKSSLQQSTISLQKRHLSLMLDTTDEDEQPEAESQTKGRVGLSIYKEYFLAAATAAFVALVFFLFFLAQFCASSIDLWTSIWSHAEEGDSTMDNVFWSERGLNRYGFVLLIGLGTVAIVIIALIRAFTFFSLCMKSSIKLHDKMFECISRSPMSFFHANPSGRILNRFSKDMGAVDELLPQAMIDCFQIFLNLLGVVIVILVTDVTLLIPTAMAIFMFYYVRLIYTRTTGAVKRLEGITRSPVFSHLNATVMGLATVRSYGAEYLLGAEFDRHQDLHSGAWYLFISSSRAFGYFLDMICLMFIICVTFSCLLRTNPSASNVGLLITQAISMTGIFQWGMRQSAEVENQMTSVERVIEYTKLPQEPYLRSTPDNKPPANWPPKGLIHFDELSLRYTPNGNYVLHKLQFKILPQEKIGIVGRTGAGKSSIIQALFRLAYLEGTIIIDGIDVSNIGLHDLREKITIIPQEPVLFSGTMRKNLDPFDNYPDELLLRALQNVELQSEEGDIGALYKQVSEGGANFSVGERQLVCLARAIVHNDRILVLDEATANVDTQTDALIQTAIREHFKHCTMLTIAHRLNTVIDSHKILVLDAGRLMEYDHPHILLQNQRSYFYRMVGETGPTMAPALHEKAAQSYKNMMPSNE